MTNTASNLSNPENHAASVAEGISLSPAAVSHVREAIARRGHGLGVRVRIKKTGCSGYQYLVEYADSEDEMDHRFDCGGVQVFIDPKSLAVIRGSRLDYVRQGLNKGFVFENPNEKARCGCGESFSA